MKIAVSNLLPNPFRHLERYPIDKDKVAALVTSITDTSFWDNLLVRKAPKKPGKFEIAYGHHRLVALQEAEVEDIDVPVRDLDDTAMARIMAHENMEEWGHNTLVEQETVRSIIDAFAKGQIKLPPVKKGTHRGTIRIAPSFITIADGEGSPYRESSYTAESLTKFLGWKPHKVEAVLAVLASIDEERIDEEDVAPLTTLQAATVARETRYAEKKLPDTPQRKAQVRGIGKAIAKGFDQAVRGIGPRSGKRKEVQDVTMTSARTRTDELIRPHLTQPKAKKLPNAHQFIENMLRANIDEYPTAGMEEKLATLLAAWDNIEAVDRKLLLGGMRRAIQRQQQWVDKFEAATKKLEAVA